MKPDVEAIFEFSETRKGAIFDGYRPSHLIKEDYLTTGVHKYYTINENNKGEIQGTITFISPEEYPESMWIGKRIEMYEGKNLVGYATIQKIFNPRLQKSELSF